MQFLSEYNPDWPEWFRIIERYLRPQLPDCIPIEHVGSTSVVGMVAKPIIDIDIVVFDGAMPAAIAAVHQAGYLHQGDLGVVGREAFKPNIEITSGLPPHHLYACESSSAELRKHISFREYLAAHPLEALRLSIYKRHLAFDLRLTRDEYIAAKAPVVDEIATMALDWYGECRDRSYAAP